MTFITAVVAIAAANPSAPEVDWRLICRHARIWPLLAPKRMVTKTDKVKVCASLVGYRASTYDVITRELRLMYTKIWPTSLAQHVDEV
jgi:hypothetical protein